MKVNNHGYSLMETLLGTVIISSVIGASALFIKQSTDLSRKVEDKVNFLQNEQVIGSVLWNDLKSAGHSFGLLETYDSAGKLFYDFLPDYACRPKVGEPCDRTLTLSSATGRELSIITERLGVEKTVPFSPGSFYTLGATPSNITESASLIFDPTKLADFLKAQPGYFENGQVLRFYSPGYLRSGNVITNPETPAKMPSFVAVVDGNEVIGTFFSGLTTQRHPLTQASYSDLGVGAPSARNSFLKTLPAVGGANAIGIVAAVNVVQYKVESRGNKQQLIRYKFDGRVFANPQVIAESFGCVKFYRKSISSKSISFSILNKGSTECVP